MYHTETLYLKDGRTIEIFGDYCAGYYWTCDKTCESHGPFETATDATVDALKQEI